MKKVSVIGAGHVGATAVYYIAEKNIAEIVMLDVVEGLATSKSIDFMHASPLRRYHTNITGTTDYRAIEDSDVVVFTAGIARRPGMDRMDLLKTNVGIAKQAAQNIARYAPNAIIIAVTNPLDVIADIDRTVASTCMHVLITETTGQKGIMFELGEDGSFREIPVSENAQKALKAISSSCEPTLVSAIYMGGTGGSARAGVTLYPVKLTKAVHAAKANLTVGGAPVFVLPGGGINFLVDVGRVKTGSFYWTPTPATICPVEYTMALKDYEEMGGHLEAMRPFTAKDPIQVAD